MKRINAIAAAGAAILAIGVYLADSGILLPASSEVAAASAAPSSVAPSPAATIAPPSRAATLETVALKVDGMWCPSCSYFVTQALTRTPGVLDAKVSGPKGTALVTYDPSKTTVAALIAATTNYGYPSTLLTTN